MKASTKEKIGNIFCWAGTIGAALYIAPMAVISIINFIKALW